MGWGLLLLLTGLPAGCNAQITAAPGDGPIDAAAPGEDAPTAPTDAAALGPWRAPGTIPQASTGASEDDVTLSSNALEMIFAIDSANGKDLFYSSRSSTDAAAQWTAAAPVPFNSGQSDETPRLSADDLTLYFASGRAGNGTLDIFKVTRTAPGNTTWGNPQRMTAVSTTNLVEKWFMPCGTDHYIMVQSVGTANGQTDLVEGTLGGPKPAPIVELNSAASETGTFVSPDCLTIYFASARTTPQQIYTSHRLAIGSPWASPPSPVTDFPILTGTGNGNQEDPWLSPDGRTFVFVSDSAGTKDIYLSTR
jgi:Tol biopolymer transport system component